MFYGASCALEVSRIFKRAQQKREERFDETYLCTKWLFEPAPQEKMGGMESFRIVSSNSVASAWLRNRSERHMFGLLSS